MAAPTRIVVDTVDTGKEILAELSNQIQSGSLLNIYPTPLFVNNMMFAIARDRVSHYQHPSVREKAHHHLAELIEARLLTSIVDSRIQSQGRFDQHHRFAGYMLDRNQRLNILFTFIMEGKRGLIKREGFSYTDVDLVVGLFEEYIPSVNRFSLKDQDEALSGFVDNQINLIEDLGPIWRFGDNILSRIAGNPFDVWTITQRPHYLVLEHEGDYRILDYNRRHAIQEKPYEPDEEIRFRGR